MSSSTSSRRHANRAAEDGGENPVPVDLPDTFSFSAGGWFQMYHFGVAQALRESGYLQENTRFVGTSAGSLAASALAGRLDIEAMRDYALECGDHCRLRFWHLFCMRDYVAASVSRFGAKIMSEDARTGTTKVRDRLRDTLEIYATVLPFMESKVFTDFTDLEDIEEALLASCCLAPLVGMPFRLRNGGQWVCDGGVTAFQPRGGEAGVITVSPFYFAQADIRPSTFVPFWWCVRPPRREEHLKLFNLGFNDCIDFLVRTGKCEPSLISKRKKTASAPRRGYFPVVKDLMALCFMYVIGRPIAILVVYMEMWTLSFVEFIAALIAGKDRVNRLWDWYCTVRNAVSLRVFFRLLFGYWIPINESRLAKYSPTYRFFRPIVFPVPEAEDKAPRRPKRRFKVEIFQNNPVREFLAKHTNVAFVRRDVSPNPNEYVVRPASSDAGESDVGKGPQTRRPRAVVVRDS